MFEQDEKNTLNETKLKREKKQKFTKIKIGK